METATTTTLALVQRNDNNDKPQFSLESIPRPEPEAHQLLVKSSHVAQNPTDVQSFDRNAFGTGTVFGCDFAGTAEKLGKDVTRVKQGDVIAGLIWGGEIKGLGAYSAYTIADERICFRIPPSISPAAASTVPLAATTAWLALFSNDSLAINRQKEEATSVLVWGGSSSVGQFTIQLARLQNLKVITTCSPRNFDLVKGFGADHVFDYSDADVIGKISEVAPELKYVFDTIGNASSSATASKALAKEGGGGKLCTVRPGKANTDDVEKGTQVSDVLVWTAFLKEHRYGEMRWPPNKGDHELAAELYERLPEWLESGKLVPNRTRVKKGLDSVKEGYQEHRDRKISAVKIVYEL